MTNIYSRLPVGLCKATKRFRFDSLVCVYPTGHKGGHAFVDPFTVVAVQSRNPDYYPVGPFQSDECWACWRGFYDGWLWCHNYVPAVFWLGWLLLEVWRFWCRLVKRLENDLNHPYWQPYGGYPGSRWGPLFPWLCVLTDWITRGDCHD